MGRFAGHSVNSSVLLATFSPSAFLRCALAWAMLAMCAAVQSAYGQIFVNEVCASNTAIVADEDGDYEDWIELYNSGEEAVNLDGYFISDDDGMPFMYALPEVWIEAGGFLVIWASGKDRVGEGGEIHTNFSISSSGEPILLTRPDGEEEDAVPAVVLAANMTYGRITDGADDFYYFTSPTPGSSNNGAEGADTYLQPPTLLSPPGFYTEAFDLFLDHPDPEVEIRYTLDGSIPTAADALYTGPLNLTDITQEPEQISAIPTTPLFAPDWYRWFEPMGPVYKGHSLRVRAFKTGAIASPTETGLYVIAPDADSRYNLPVVSITTPEGSLFGPTGIYTNHLMTGPNWEREAHFQLFETNGTPVFSTNIGLRLHGGNSRRYALKSFRLYFRGSLGAGALEYPIFPEGEVHTHERLLLRNSGSEWSRTYFRDAFAQQLLREYTDVDYMRYRPAITFVNGEYWGVLNIRERFDDNYIRNHYGYARDEIDMLENIAGTVYGSNNDYLALRAFMQNQDLDDPENYAHVASQMDVDNFRDYHIIQIFAMNTDQPGKNVRWWRAQEGGKWRWMLFDLDDSFAFGPHCDYDRNGLVYCSGLNTISSAAVNPASSEPSWAPNGPGQTLPLREMLRSTHFRPNFINRFADLLNTAFMPERLESILDAFDDQIDPYMQEHYERWHRPEPDFRQSHLDLVYTFAAERKGAMEEHMVDFFELDGTYDLQVQVQPASGGHVKVNSIFIHPDSVYLPEGPTYPWAGTYYQGVELPLTAAAAPGFTFSHWLENGSTEDTLWISPGGDATYTAVFEDAGTQESIHYWSFNGAFWDQYTQGIGGGVLMGLAGAVTEYLLDDGADFENNNARYGAELGTHLRVNHPDGTALIFEVPTTGYKYPILSYEARRSGQGAGLHRVLVSTDGGASYILADSADVYNDVPQLYTFDFSALLGTANNADLVVKIEMVEAEGGTAGNNRFDNVSVDAIPFNGQNEPPGLAAPLFRHDLIAEGEVEVLQLNDLFEDPDGDPIGFTLDAPDGDVAIFSLNGAELQVTPLATGLTHVTLEAFDGVNAPVEVTLEVMVHPAPVFITPIDGFAFTHWDPDQPEGLFPSHMLFVQGTTPDPGLETPLRYPYHLGEEDYHEDDEMTVGFPYNNTRRTRINGLDDEGISLINTGRDRDLGGVIVALNTEFVTGPIYASWLASTLLPNSRVYRLRLQYRVGLDAEFQDVLVDGEPVEYERQEIPLQTEAYELIPLPDDLLDAPYAQLMWRYYYTGEQADESIGARAMLRLDNIVIGTATFDAAVDSDGSFGLAVYPNPAQGSFFMEHSSDEDLSMAMYSLEGKMLFEQRIHAGQPTEVAMPGYAPGLYILEVTSEAGLSGYHKVVLSGD